MLVYESLKITPPVFLKLFETSLTEEVHTNLLERVFRGTNTGGGPLGVW